MRAAVETATKADTIRTSRHHNSDIAAQATAGESGLLILLLKSKQRVSFFLHEDWLHATSLRVRFPLTTRMSAIGRLQSVSIGTTDISQTRATR